MGFKLKTEESPSPGAAEAPHGPGWWQASDHKWYPPHLHPNYQALPPPPRPTAPSQRATEIGTGAGRPPRVQGKARPWAWVALAAVALLVIIATLASSSSKQPSPSTAGHATQVAAFNSFVSQVRADLNACTVPGAVVQVELGQILQNPAAASESDLVQLDDSTHTAQTGCDMAKSDDILNLGSLSIPNSITWIHSLNNAALDAETWATQDTTAVLHDVQKLAESGGNPTALVSQFDQDATTADQDASTVRYDFSNAAQRLGISNFSGLGLITWTS